jgi:hypothetical protein
MPGMGHRHVLLATAQSSGAAAAALSAEIAAHQARSSSGASTVTMK